jgi:hypothetical protein
MAAPTKELAGKEQHMMIYAESNFTADSEDCGYLDTGRVKIGSRWHESQISTTTPRTRGHVQYLGAHAERLQRSLLEPPRNRIADVLLACTLGILAAALLVHWWSA